jgi:hypothetical protein
MWIAAEEWAMRVQKRDAARIRFEHGYNGNIVAVDGTWHRKCFVEDVSRTGAKVTVVGPLEGLTLDEFFLVFGGRGGAYRRCQMRWFKGETMGLRFLRSGERTS